MVVEIAAGILFGSMALLVPIMSCFYMPFQSLGYELTPDYKERTSVQAWRSGMQKAPEVAMFAAAAFTTAGVWIGATWTELRICLSCGHVGCCESSEHAHALQHFNVTAHPMIAPLDRRETWGWCYVHRRYFDPMPATVTPAPAVRSTSRSRFAVERS